MGIADRFKKKLEHKDIFSKVNTETNKYISSPIEKEIVKPVANILASDDETAEKRYPLEDLESQIIEKIRRTPYWKEYSIQKQETLISSYFKNKQNIYNDISDEDKKEFIKNIIILSNNT